VRKSIGAVLLALGLAACGAPAPRESAPHATSTPENPSPAAAGLYRIDPAQSELRILVYRAGAMAALGHNHVIVNRSLTGWIAAPRTPAAASFSLSLPSAQFTLDEAALRSEEGADFEEPVADDARAGTLRNMLSPALLDAAEFPQITVRSVAITAGPVLEATVALDVAGHDSTLVVPFTVDIAGDRLTARAAFSVRQSALGLTPFSVLLGALRVEDQMRLKVKLVAVAAAGTAGTGS